MRIYTRGGDKGKTGIHGGERVDKDDIRIEANGTLDELNAEIGIVRTLLPPDHEWQVLLGRIQREMMAVMSHVATPSAIRDQNPNPLPDDLTVFCESHIDDLSGIRFGCRHLRDLLLIIGIMPLQVKPLLKISPA